MKKILVIEDENQVRRIYKSKLLELGFQVIEAEDGKTALSKLDQTVPDLVILDIMLPGGMNGFDVLEKMKADENFQKIPVIVLTNLSTQEKIARKIGVYDYVVKANTPIHDVIKKIKKSLQ